jgi:chromosome partitioning protein
MLDLPSIGEKDGPVTDPEELRTRAASIFERLRQGGRGSSDIPAPSGEDEAGSGLAAADSKDSAAEQADDKPSPPIEVEGIVATPAAGDPSGGATGGADDTTSGGTDAPAGTLALSSVVPTEDPGTPGEGSGSPASAFTDGIEAGGVPGVVSGAIADGGVGGGVPGVVSGAIADGGVGGGVPGVTSGAIAAGGAVDHTSASVEAADARAIADTAAVVAVGEVDGSPAGAAAAADAADDSSAGVAASDPAGRGRPVRSEPIPAPASSMSTPRPAADRLLGLSDTTDGARGPGWRASRPLPRILAIANQKGGVGKTTTAVNLGAALAELGYRVLVIDLDPQGNATTGLGINARNLDASVYDVLLHDVPIEDCIEPTSLRNLFVVPATIDLAGAEIELVPVFSRELRLRRAVELVTDDFDFVLIDCPPSLGLLTVNGLAAATEVVVPIQCEYYALEGLGQLLRNVNLVQSNLNAGLEVTTIILTMFDARTRLAEQVVAEVRSHFGDRVCRNVVPRTVRLSEAPSFGQPIIVFDSSSRGAIAYRELAKEVSGGAPQRIG